MTGPVAQPASGRACVLRVPALAMPVFGVPMLVMGMDCEPMVCMLLVVDVVGGVLDVMVTVGVAVVGTHCRWPSGGESGSVSVATNRTSGKTDSSRVAIAPLPAPICTISRAGRTPYDAHGSSIRWATS